ncbi:tetratricopeptide repeat-containing sulfotransferase family protein [Rhodosalinus sp.]|uniref:tetratricopeptide repeat-containing sulfotransferase family protein n=1 Tax=Rhodosalinus sp. TaxID=2047741 RepID=UPI0035693D5F
MAGDPAAEARKIARLLETGRTSAAHKAARVAMKRWPREAFFANLAGIARAQSGAPRDAAGFFRKALKLRPDFAEAVHNLAQAMVAQGAPEQAERLLAKHLSRHPADSAALRIRAAAAIARAAPAEADRFAGQALDHAPRDPEALAVRALSRAQRGDHAAAMPDYEASLAIRPDDPRTLSNMAEALAMQSRSEEALAALERALAQAPAHPDALENYALQLHEAGRREDSRAAWHRLLEVAPDNARALRWLAVLEDAEGCARLRPRIARALKRAGRVSPDGVLLTYARARIAQTLGDAEAAERHLAETHAADAQLRPHDFAAAEAECARILTHFTKGMTARAPCTRTAGPRPVFVVGMMRSGTTLTERILSAHPSIFGAGERNTAPRLLLPQTQGRAGWTDEAAAVVARDYRADLPSLPEGTSAVVDKMPANHKLVGYLATAMPEACFVHLQRDPRDVALSIWQGHFPSADLTFTTDLAAIAQMANLYRRYMQRWAALFPGRILDVPYEALVTDVEGWSRRLAVHAGVDWVPAMATPESTGGAVRTASTDQVREQVHGRSVGRWRAHREVLAPFVAALDPDLWPDLASG